MLSWSVRSAAAFLLCAGGLQSTLLAQTELPRLRRELDAIAGAAAARDPRLLADRSSVDAATQRARVGLPRAPLGLEAEVEEIPPGSSPLDAQQARFSVTSSLYRGGRPGAARASFTAATDLATARLELSRAAIEADLRLDLAGWMAWRGVEQRLAAQDSLFAMATDLLRARFSVGTARYLDVLRLRTERLQVARARAAAAAEADARLARMRILAVRDSTLARRIDEQVAEWDRRAAWTELATLLDAPSASPVDTIVARILAARRSAINAEAARERAEQGVGVAGAIGIQRFPGLGGQAVTGPTFGLSVTLPFTLTGTYGAVRRTIELRRQTDSLQLSAEHSDWVVRRQRALLSSAAARGRATLFDEALLAGATEEREAAFAGFRGGSVSLLELIDFERSLAEVAQGRLLAILDVLAADGTLATAAASSFLRTDAADSEGDTP